MKHAALLISALLFVSCAPSSYRPEGASSGLVVPVTHGWTKGSGAVVGSCTVLTAGHVLRAVDSTIWVAGRKATVVDSIPALRESILVLRIDSDYPPFHARDVFRIAVARGPHTVWTLRGSSSFKPSKIISGDSGAPVLDRHGHLVGVVFGRQVPYPLTDWDEHSPMPRQETVVDYLPLGWRLR